MQQNHNPEAGRLGIFRSIHIDGEKTNRMTRRMIRLSSHQLSSQHPLGKCPRFNIGLSHCLLATASCLALVAAIVEDPWSNGISADSHLSRLMPKHSYKKMVLCHIASRINTWSLIWYPWNSPPWIYINIWSAYIETRLSPSLPSGAFSNWTQISSVAQTGEAFKAWAWLAQAAKKEPPREARFGNTWKIWMKQKGCLQSWGNNKEKCHETSKASI